VAVTVAPGILAPEASLTYPLMSPVLICAAAGKAANARSRKVVRNGLAKPLLKRKFVASMNYINLRLKIQNAPPGGYPFTPGGELIAPNAMVKRCGTESTDPERKSILRQRPMFSVFH
jgi:hypothetical protein